MVRKKALREKGKQTDIRTKKLDRKRCRKAARKQIQRQEQTGH